MPYHAVTPIDTHKNQMYRRRNYKAKEKREEEQERKGIKNKPDKIPLTPEQHRLVTDNLDLAYWWLNRMLVHEYIRNLGEEEGKSIAYAALVHAACKYDPSRRIKDADGNELPDGRCVKFSTYASWWLQQYLRYEGRKEAERRTWVFSEIEENVENSNNDGIDHDINPFTLNPLDHRERNQEQMTEMLEELEKVRSHFTESDWEILVLYYAEGRTLKEIALLQNCTDENVRQKRDRVMRRIGKLRAEGRI